MDVRCERCQTEYELDDASIPEAGVPVQCTTCGYTFSVKRVAEGRTVTARFTPTVATGAALSPPPVAITREDLPAAPPQATWILETEDGKVHRLRDLTTLQKWVVERRVTANDRLSRDGGRSWRELEEVEELIPFFEVVGEADRAKANSATSGPPSPGPGTSSRSSTNSGVGKPAFGEVERTRGVPPRLPVDAGFSTEAQSRGRGLPGSIAPVEGGPFRERLPGLDSVGGGAVGLETPLELEDGDELLQPRRRRAPMVVVGLLLAGALGGGGYYLYGRGLVGSSRAGSSSGPAAAPAGSASSTTSPPTASSTEASGAPPGAATPPGSPGSVPTATSLGTEAAGRPIPSSAAGAKQAASGAGGASSALAPPSPSAAVPGQGATSPASAAAAPEVAGPAPSPGVAVVPLPSPPGDDGNKPSGKERPASFDRLVAEGDKLLENGQTNRAEKMYVQALALKPDGVSALTGTGYVFLDRGRTQKALEIFQRALSLDGRYGPAVFGLAEAYRAQGDQDSALNTYKQYLTTNPSGADASAARRQVHDLEAAARNAAIPKDSP